MPDRRPSRSLRPAAESLGTRALMSVVGADAPADHELAEVGLELPEGQECPAPDIEPDPPFVIEPDPESEPDEALILPPYEWRYRQPGQPGVPIIQLPGDVIDRYYNYLAERWNRGEIAWPFRGDPPPVGGPRPANPPAIAAEVEVLPINSIPPNGRDDWFTRVVQSPRTRPDGTDDGFVVVHYLLGMRTSWYELGR